MANRNQLVASVALAVTTLASAQSWVPVGPGLDNVAQALAASNDALFVGGYMGSTHGGAPNTMPYIAQFNATGWSSLGVGLSFDVRALAATNTALFAGGDFTTTAEFTSLNYVGQWKDGAWCVTGDAHEDHCP